MNAAMYGNARLARVLLDDNRATVDPQLLEMAITEVRLPAFCATSSCRFTPDGNAWRNTWPLVLQGPSDSTAAAIERRIELVEVLLAHPRVDPTAHALRSAPFCSTLPGLGVSDCC